MALKILNDISLAGNTFNVEDLCDEAMQVDFEKIIPIPAALKNARESSVKDFSVAALYFDCCDRMEYYPEEKEELVKLCDEYKLAAEKERITVLEDRELFDKKVPAVLEVEGLSSEEGLLTLGEKYMDNYRKYGAMTWKTWSEEHWLCIGNAETVEVSPEKMVFYTQNGYPEEIFKAISRLYKDNRLLVTCICEGNAIYPEYLNGECINEDHA